LIDEIGRGAMGEVHVAKDLKLKRKVALKWIKEGKVDQQSKFRFIREILITSQLDHPNIVPIYTMERSTTGNLAYSMKWIKGRTLGDLIAERVDAIQAGKLENGTLKEEFLEIFLKICEAMAYAHAKQVIHRDLKPSNIMIGPYGEVYVMDWGIARVIGTKDIEYAGEIDVEKIELGGDGYTTQDGAVVGTLSYISPEQAQGEVEQLDQKTDQYALGLILFNLMTLQPPIPKGKLLDMLRRARRGQIAPVVHLSPKKTIAPELEAIIEKATDNSPDKRYESVDALAEDIRRYLHNEEVTAKPDLLLAKITRLVSKHRTKTLIAFMSLALFALVSNIYNLNQQQTEREATQIREIEMKESIQLRSRRTGQIMADVSKQGGRIDQELLYYKGLLRELTSAAQARLILEPSVVTSEAIYMSSDFDQGKGPADLRLSSRYKKELSLDYAGIKLAPKVELTPEIEKEVKLLGSLSPVFYNIFMEALPDGYESKEEIRTAILEGGESPVIWAFVGSEKGVHSAYPGKGGYKPDYDPRERPWYKASIDQKEPLCQAPYIDASGQGQLLPCTDPVFGADGQLLGVAGIEFSFSYIVESLLILPSFAKQTDSFLLNSEGEILVSSLESSKTGDIFYENIIVNEILERRSGFRVLATEEGRRLYFYVQMGNAGWYYVVQGLEKELLPE
jgi:serine/threonine protein kinase